MRWISDQKYQTVPSFVEKLFGWDSFAAGLIFLVMATPSLLEPLFGRLTTETNTLAHQSNKMLILL
jgi:hypothetical protein